MESERPHRTSGNTSSSSSSSELFICFTSRLSSSSMKISSKSILSPGRARDPAPLSLSTSLSRRLRTNASMKGAGQASPMFPTGGGKKRGCAFENPEPSSPKVTCIGQVRVKSKKKQQQQGKKLRSLSRRHSAGEISFRKLEQAVSLSLSHSQRHGTQNRGPNYQQGNVGSSSSNQETMMPQQRNQRWVHLPSTICEALRTFGSEFSCLFPCSKSSCFSTSEREKEGRAAAGRSGVGDDAEQQSSCGAVFRWLVALQDGEGTGGKGGRREIELVVGGDDNDNEQMRTSEFREESGGVRNSRRHVFEDLEIVDRIEVTDEEAARFSICVPPKNALLLMRCRSDPVKMEALTSKFWESPAAPHVDDFDAEDEEEREEEKEFKKCEVELRDEQVLFSVEVDEERENVKVEAQGNADVEANLEMASTDFDEEDEEEREEEKEFKECEVELRDEQVLFSVEVELKQRIEEEEEDQEIRLDFNEVVQEDLEEETDLVHSFDEDESLFLDCLFEDFVDELEHPIQEEEAQAEATIASRYTTPIEDGKEEEEKKEETLVEELATLELEAKESIEVKETQDCNFEDEKEMVTHERFEVQEPPPPQEEEASEKDVESKERESKSQRSALPECLLLMMCEPKLSMEVSKETWVCSTDFIRRHPERKKPQAAVKLIDRGDEPIEKMVNAEASSISISNNPAPVVAFNAKIHHQPPRSSCSLPGPAAAASMATMLEQKLVNAVGYEPFVLTRCKSEPMRKASLLVPETCFWKNRKLEPLRRAAYGVSAAGLGF